MFSQSQSSKIGPHPGGPLSKGISILKSYVGKVKVLSREFVLNVYQTVINNLAQNSQDMILQHVQSNSIQSDRPKSQGPLFKGLSVMNQIQQNTIPGVSIECLANCHQQFVSQFLEFDFATCSIKACPVKQFQIQEDPCLRKCQYWNLMLAQCYFQSCYGMSSKLLSIICHIIPRI